MIDRYSYDKSCQSRLWQNIKQIKHSTVTMPEIPENAGKENKSDLTGEGNFKRME